MTIKEDLCIDVHRFLQAFCQCRGTAVLGADIFTVAAQRASGIPDLELTREQRQALKTMVHAMNYGATETMAMHMAAKNGAKQ
jgi:DNA polymerase I-like protein with 3'-5' exonuclease and polymerase domains